MHYKAWNSVTFLLTNQVLPNKNDIFSKVDNEGRWFSLPSLNLNISSFLFLFVQVEFEKAWLCHL